VLGQPFVIHPDGDKPDALAQYDTAQRHARQLRISYRAMRNTGRWSTCTWLGTSAASRRALSISK
jgi:hypothetical protein